MAHPRAPPVANKFLLHWICSPSRQVRWSAGNVTHRPGFMDASPPLPPVTSHCLPGTRRCLPPGLVCGCGAQALSDVCHPLFAMMRHELSTPAGRSSAGSPQLCPPSCLRSTFWASSQAAAFSSRRGSASHAGSPCRFSAKPRWVVGETPAGCNHRCPP